MTETFSRVYHFLIRISEISGLSYTEINIILYFVVLPLIYFILLDKLIGKHFFKAGYFLLIILLIIFSRNFLYFSNRLFDKAVAFLEWFEIIGLNYVQASVIFCVIFPFIILTVLIAFVYKDKIKKLYSRLKKFPVRKQEVNDPSI